MRDSRSEILQFWFEETEPRQWFQRNEAFDAIIRGRFLGIYQLARDGVCDAWMGDAQGCLSLCLVLDQFPRNMFRDHADAFATDDKALAVARHAVEKSFDRLVPPVQRRFLYLPFEHSENLSDQERSVELFATLKDHDPPGYDYARRHRDVIARFGRFPGRNAALGRETTADEIAFLRDHDEGF